MAGTLGAIGSVVGIGSGLSNIFGHHGGGGGVTGGATGVYQPEHQGEADTAFQQMLQQYMQSQGQQAGAINPVLAQAFQQMLGLPMNQLYGNLGEIAGGFGQRLNEQAYTNQNAQQGLMGAGNQLWQTALDPQNALRDRMQQQVTDASRAGTSARGIGMSGEAAGIENQDVRDFLMNWQNAQLGRQATGLQGMTGAYGEAGRQGQQVGQNLAGSINMGALSPQFLQAGASFPMTAANMYSGAQNPLLQQLIAGMGAGNQYMGMGQNASNIGFGQQQTGINSLTTGLGQLANLFRAPPSGGNDGYQTDPYATGGYGT